MPRHYMIESNGDLHYILMKTSKARKEQTGRDWLYLNGYGHGPFSDYGTAYRWLLENKLHNVKNAGDFIEDREWKEGK